MKKGLNLLLEESRHDKLKAIATYKKRTMTQIVSDWIDRLQDPRASVRDSDAQQD